MSEVNLRPRVILVGIGGATCSGKTTLAKHLRSILPESAIVHQDDFAPPQELIPIHPVYNIQDWDAPRGAIDWPRFSATLQYVKTTGGDLPPEHSSHDHLNAQKEVHVSEETYERWRKVFADLETAHRAKGERLIWRLVDGFLLYWHKASVDALDVRILLRVPEDVLRQRRHERHGYHTAEGSLWRDPPHYWEQIVWPAYVEAHTGLFVGGDLARGAPAPVAPSTSAAVLDGDSAPHDGGPVKDLVVVEALEHSMGEIVDLACALLQKAAETSRQPSIDVL